MRINMYFPRLFLLLSFLLSVYVAYGQEGTASVYGKVMQEKKGTNKTGPLYGANVILVNNIEGKRDTLYTVTDLNGAFRFINVQAKASSIKVSSVGFEALESRYELEAGRNLCYFTLYETAETLSTAEVSAEATLLRHVGDTTIFNASAVQTMEGERLRDLFDKLPGFRVEGDRVLVDGEDVKRTYVNGVLLFGSNVITAANSLYASEVKQVKVYDEQTPEDKVRGLHNVRKNRVLNIITTEALASFTEAVVSASGGVDNTGQMRYTGIASAAFYSELMSFDAEGIFDNTSQGLGITSGSAPSSVLHGLGARTGQLSSYKEDIVAGASFEKYWKSRDFGNNIRAEYKFRHNYGRQNSVRSEEHYLKNGAPGRSSRDSLNAYDFSGKHEVGITVTIQNNPRRRLYGRFGGEYESATQYSRDAGRVMNAGKMFIRDESSLSDNKEYNVYGRVVWEDYSFKSVKFSSRLGFSRNATTSPSERTDTLSESTVRIKLVSDGVGTESNASFAADAEWVPINSEAKTWRLGGMLNYSWQQDLRKQESFNLVSGAQVPYLSETFNYTYGSMQPTVNIYTQFTTKAISIRAGINTTWAIIECSEHYPSDGTINKVFPAVLPSFTLNWKSVKINIDAKQVLPSAAQIRKRISDTNPFALVGGNPNIRSSYNVEAGVDWSKTFGLTSAFASFHQLLSWDSIISRAIYFNEDTELTEWDGYKAMAGSMLYTFDNANTPVTASSLSVNLDRLMARRKLKSGIRLRGSIVNRPMYFSSEYVDLLDKVLASSLFFQWTPDKHWKASLSPGISWQHSTGGQGSTISESLNYNLKSSVSIRYNAFLGRVSYSMNYLDYLSGPGKNVFRNILNASVGWTILKKQLEVRLEAFDILNAGSVYSMTLTPEAMTQVWTPTYGRSIMLTATYHFRKK